MASNEREREKWLTRITWGANVVVDHDGELVLALAALRHGIANGVLQSGVALVRAKVAEERAAALDRHHGAAPLVRFTCPIKSVSISNLAPIFSNSTATFRDS